MKYPRLLTAVALIIAAAVTAAAQNQHTNQARGFSANGVYSSHDIDHINLFNGNLVVTIPVGGSYPVGGQLSYQFTLVYNSTLWTQRELCTSNVTLSQAFFTTWVDYHIYQDDGGIVAHIERPPRASDDPYVAGPARGPSDG